MKNNLYNGIKERLFYTLGKRPEIATTHDFYMALSYAVRDQMMTYWLDLPRHPRKEVAYLSAEFLIGPQLNNNLLKDAILISYPITCGRDLQGRQRLHIASSKTTQTTVT